jgi:hypothetical protein
VATNILVRLKLFGISGKQFSEPIIYKDEPELRDRNYAHNCLFISGKILNSQANKKISE